MAQRNRMPENTVEHTAEECGHSLGDVTTVAG
jgi:hypothetical protein